MAIKISAPMSIHGALLIMHVLLSMNKHKQGCCVVKSIQYVPVSIPPTSIPLFIMQISPISNIRLTAMSFVSKHFIKCSK